MPTHRSNPASLLVPRVSSGLAWNAAGDCLAFPARSLTLCSRSRALALEADIAAGDEEFASLSDLNQCLPLYCKFITNIPVVPDKSFQIAPQTFL